MESNLPLSSGKLKSSVMFQVEVSEFRNIAHAHLRAGTTPCQSSFDALTRSLPKLRSKLEALESKQRELETTIEQVNVHRVGAPLEPSEGDPLVEVRHLLLQVQQAIQAYHALFAPIRRLPTELLQAIFLISLPYFTIIPPDRDQVPILFTHISHLWRRAAISMPQLWSSMEFLLDESSSSSTEDVVLRATDLWLERAASSPLTLYLRERAPSTNLLMDKLNVHRCQWRELILHYDGLPPSLLLGTGDAPILESFELRRHGLPWLDGSQHPEVFSLVNSTSQLRRLVWYVDPLPSIDRWGKLLFLDLGSAVSVTTCADILGSCPLLTEVAFRHLHESTARPNLPVLHSELRSFTAYVDLDLATLFPYFTFPNLEELVLTATTRNQDEGDGVIAWPESEFSKFFVRSRCPLRTLTLYFPPLTESSLIKCLRDIQNTLEELTLQLVINPKIITDHVIDMMMHNEDEDARGEDEGVDSGADAQKGLCLCPRLQVLALYNSVACSPGRLAAMVKSRMKVSVLSETHPRYVARMRMVECFDGGQDLDLLKELAREGLTLKLYSSETGALVHWEQQNNVQDASSFSSL